ncbi:arginine N-succinyltransferase [Candidatus Marinamargulisbacteria bacterium SCGC AG-439-L15]|nr:arginine N-succinyltransferase [Candidatus Marinamargulisbacteria bacterium SCGC AG-439-L15]
MNSHKQFIIRPVKSSDLKAIYHLAMLKEPGLTSLTRHKPTLKKMIEESVQSFKTKTVKTLNPNGFYLFVLEDLKKKTAVGTCSITARVGVKSPFFYFERFTVTKNTSTAQKYYRLLQLHAMRYGPSEIGTLFIHPDYRKKGLGRLLSFSRFLFMACFPNLVDTSIIAEMRGVSSVQGKSPFWDSLGKHFFELSFEEADSLSSTDKSFIQELIPRYPIYEHFLTKKAQEVIGKPHPKTVPALHLLEQEGFQRNKHIDIFDGGPKVSAITQSIRSIAHSQTLKVSHIQKEVNSTTLSLVSSRKFKTFRVCIAPLEIQSNKIRLNKTSAKQLQVKQGDTVQITSLYPPKDVR